jgi:hypothetical protein
MREPLPLTRRIKVSKEFYVELVSVLEPAERILTTEGEIGTGLILWTIGQKRLIFYYQEPVKEPVVAHPTGSE